MTSNGVRKKSKLAAVLSFQAVGFALGLIIHILLSRWLGHEAYGDLAVTLSVVALGSTLALLGFDKAATSRLADYSAEGRGDLASGFLRTALGVIGTASLVMACLGWAAARSAEIWLGVDEHPVRYAALFILPASVAAFLGRCLSGLKRPLLASGLGQIAGRLMLIGALLWVAGQAVAASEQLAVGLILMSWLFGTVLLAVAMLRYWPHRGAASYRRREWLTSSLSFMAAALAITGLEQSAILVLEIWHADDAVVGIFAAAHRTANLPLIALVAVRSMAVPELATAWRRDPAEIGSVLRPYVRFLMASAAGALVIFVVLGDEVLALFGESTEQGHLILILLGAGHALTLSTGLVGPMLQIRGQHKLLISSMLAQLAIALVLAIVAMPRFGAEGVAAAYAIAALVVLGFLVRQLPRHVGVSYFQSLWS